LATAFAALPFQPAFSAVAAPPATQAPSAEDAALIKLFHDSDEAALKRNPTSAIYRGDMRYADRLGDNVTDAYFAGERSAAKADLAALGHIDRSKLTATDQIAYDVFKWQTELGLRGLSS